MRPSKSVARVVLIIALASVAVPGIAGAWTPQRTGPLDPAQFRPVVVRPGTPTADPDLAAVPRSDGALDPGDALIDPAAARDVPDRIGVDQPDPTAIAVPVPTPTPVPTPVPVVGVAAPPPPSTSGGWILDPNVSWYGPGFYGQRTACGLTLTTTLIGVANRTLPCGTLVTFRNPVNGVIVQAPVVDRGPYVTGRQWDLTGGLCLALDHCYTGALEYHIP